MRIHCQTWREGNVDYDDYDDDGRRLSEVEMPPNLGITGHHKLQMAD